METRPPVPRAILVGIQVPGVNDVAHAADIEELVRLVKTLGYEVVGTISQKRDEIGHCIGCIDIYCATSREPNGCNRRTTPSLHCEPLGPDRLKPR